MEDCGDIDPKRAEQARWLGCALRRPVRRALRTGFGSFPQPEFPRRSTARSVLSVVSELPEVPHQRTQRSDSYNVFALAILSFWRSRSRALLLDGFSCLRQTRHENASRRNSLVSRAQEGQTHQLLLARRLRSRLQHELRICQPLHAALLVSTLAINRHLSFGMDALRLHASCAQVDVEPIVRVPSSSDYDDTPFANLVHVTTGVALLSALLRRRVAAAWRHLVIVLPLFEEVEVATEAMRVSETANAALAALHAVMDPNCQWCDLPHCASLEKLQVFRPSQQLHPPMFGAPSFGKPSIPISNAALATFGASASPASSGAQSALPTSPEAWQAVSPVSVGSPQSPADSILSLGPSKWHIPSHGVVVTDITSRVANAKTVRLQPSDRRVPLASACQSVALNSLVTRLDHIVQKQKRAALRLWERQWGGAQFQMLPEVHRGVGPLTARHWQPTQQSHRLMSQGAKPPVDSSIPVAMAGIDVTNNGQPDLYYVGADRNQDGIPDALQGIGPHRVAVAGIDINHDGRPDLAYVGVDENRDGIPDTLQGRGPYAVMGLDMNHDGQADMVYVGADRNRDGIPDALQGMDLIHDLRADTAYANADRDGSDRSQDSHASNFCMGPSWKQKRVPDAQVASTPSFVAAPQHRSGPSQELPRPRGNSCHAPVSAVKSARRAPVQVEVETLGPPVVHGGSGIFPSWPPEFMQCPQAMSLHNAARSAFPRSVGALVSGGSMPRHYSGSGASGSFSARASPDRHGFAWHSMQSARSPRRTSEPMAFSASPRMPPFEQHVPDVWCGS